MATTMPASLYAFPATGPSSEGLADLLAHNRLASHFQPIVELSHSRVFAHEALVRTPPGSAFPTPDALFAAAREAGLTIDLELECLRVALKTWSQAPREGKLFLNMSASALVQSMGRDGFARLLGLARAAGLSVSSLVIELTEHEHVTQLQPIQEALQLLRKGGGTLALDDFGDGRSSLRLWSELRPEYVKVDKYFVQSVHQVSHKLQTLKALQQLAQTFGSSLIAEGVECADELTVLRDIGIELAQGYFLGRPAPQPLQHLGADARSVLESRQIAVLPQQRQASNRGLTARSLLIDAPAVQQDINHDDVALIFQRNPELHALALVADDKPVGLIGRKVFQDLYIQRYFRDLFGRRPCLLHANLNPLTVDVHTPVENLTQVLTSSDQRYLSEGFVVTQGGRYAGLGTGEQLVRTVTEARIEAARHANPLTFLPGNIPITLHIERLLDNGQDFVACYADLNQFKAFNDYYGYWRGDEMIRLQAQCLQTACDPRRDFVGHVGGDDFVLLLQSVDWYERLEAAVARFNNQALGLFDADAQAAGGIEAEDREGVLRFHPCTTLSLGVLRVGPGMFKRAEDVASAAAAAKHEAKTRRMGLFLVESVAQTTARPQT